MSKFTWILHNLLNGNSIDQDSILELILSHKDLDLNARDHLGQTPLMVAVRAANFSAVKVVSSLKTVKGF